MIFEQSSNLSEREKYVAECLVGGEQQPGAGRLERVTRKGMTGHDVREGPPLRQALW